MDKITPLRSRVTQFYMDVCGKRQPNVLTVDLTLSYCRKYIDAASRLDPAKLAEAVPHVIADLQKAIEGKFKLLDVQRSVEGRNQVIFFELEGDSHIAAKIFPHKIRLEGFSRRSPVLADIWELLDDFKLEQNYGTKIEQINEILSGSRTKAKIAALNWTYNMPDQRFSPA